MPAPGTISLPAPQTGAGQRSTGSASAGENGQQSGGSASAGAGGQQSDAQILAEALRELENRPGQGSGTEASGQQQQNAGPGQQGQSASGPNAGAQAGAAGTQAGTADERRQALGRELDQGLAEFDRVILSEQQANRERADQGGYAGSLDDFPADGESAQESAGPPLQTALADSGPASIKGEGNIPTRSHSNVPPDLADASGDDIIARQLREAAMKEQDPELREKLWDEYRKYKRDL